MEIIRKQNNCNPDPSTPPSSHLALFQLLSALQIFLQSVSRQQLCFLGWSLTFCFPVHCNWLLSLCCKQQLIGVFLFLSSTSFALSSCNRGLRKTDSCRAPQSRAVYPSNSTAPFLPRFKARNWQRQELHCECSPKCNTLPSHLPQKPTQTPWIFWGFRLLTAF